MDSTLKKHTISESPDIRISCDNKNYGFDIKELKIYKEYFEDFYLKGLIVKSAFESGTWILKEDVTNKRTLISFNVVLGKELIVVLKCFILNLFKSNISQGELLRYANRFQETYNETQGFNLDILSEFQDIFDGYGERKKEDVSRVAITFNDFYNHLIPIEYIDFLRSFGSAGRKARELPSYGNVLIFDLVLNDYIHNCTELERKRFLPIFLWWKITSIIPLRPIEFLDFKANCVEFDGNNYWITVPRKKIRGSSYNIEVTNVIRTTKEIYDLVNEYIGFLTEKEKSEYLFSYVAYNAFIKNERLRKGAMTKRRRTDKIDHEQFYELLDDFYTEVVESMYKYADIERVSPGDTRHFAFCNLMLQGFNMLTIARIGGHSHLKSQLSYTSHLDYFAEAKVKILSDQIKRNRIRNLGNVFNIDNRALVSRSKLYKGTGGDRRINGNICLDKDFPNNCVTDCEYCDHCILDLTNPNKLKELKEKSNSIYKKIKEQIKVMQEISKNMMYEIDTITFSYTDQEKLFTLANKLDGLFAEKAAIDSYFD